ncbi:uncharacterized protein LOC141875876 isoform X3 [Acropora palmata]|uniref:uncharacterized protein LOC141875876 isoform X3 n=1 Tax=Acropora palmata TaxID=6131 RepID=UPI003DA0DD9F
MDGTTTLSRNVHMEGKTIGTRWCDHIFLAAIFIACIPSTLYRPDRHFRYCSSSSSDNKIVKINKNLMAGCTSADNTIMSSNIE